MKSGTKVLTSPPGTDMLDGAVIWAVAVEVSLMRGPVANGAAPIPITWGLLGLEGRLEGYATDL